MFSMAVRMAQGRIIQMGNFESSGENPMPHCTMNTVQHCEFELIIPVRSIAVTARPVSALTSLAAEYRAFLAATPGLYRLEASALQALPKGESDDLPDAAGPVPTPYGLPPATRRTLTHDQP